MALNRFGYPGPVRGALCAVAGASAFLAVTDTSQQFVTEMGPTETFVLTADTDVLIAQGEDPTAAADDGSMFVPAGQPILIDGGQGEKLAVVRKAVDGVATLQLLKVLQ